MIAQVRDTTAQLRAVCNDLHPAYLNDRLSTTLRASVARLGHAHPAVRLGWAVDGAEPAALPDAVKIACKEVMDQAIQNALLHGRPSHIAVALAFAGDGTLQLTVQDDGAGFLLRARREWRAGGHHGLANMHERAELVGGRLAVDSHPGRGTRIVLQIPESGAAPAPGAGTRATLPPPAAPRGAPANGAAPPVPHPDTPIGAAPSLTRPVP